MQKGFTLLELILVIILVGVLAAVAAPRLFSTAGYDQIAARDHAIQLLQQAQLQAMNQSSECATVHISATTAWIPTTTADCSLITDNEQLVTFDIWGRPTTHAQIRMTMTGESLVQVCVEPEGYIHGC